MLNKAAIGWELTSEPYVERHCLSTLFLGRSAQSVNRDLRNKVESLRFKMQCVGGKRQEEEVVEVNIWRTI